MRFANNRGIRNQRWLTNQLLQSEDINAIAANTYMNITAVLGSIAKGVQASENRDYVIGGLTLTHDSLLTLILEAGMAVSFSGTYLSDDASWGFQSNVGDMFSVSVPQPTQVDFDPGGDDDRIDVLEIRPALANYSSQSRQFKDPITGNVTSAFTATRQEFGFEFEILKGTEGSTTAPSSTAGWIKIAEVAIPAGASSIDPTDIVDFRSSNSWTTDQDVTVLRAGLV